jgi:hypothetical protein
MIDPDLDWRAFLYASGEMTPSAAAEFEAFMERDQSAREALAEAVRSMELIARAHEPTTTASRSPRVRRSVAWREHAAWMSLGAAACLLLVVGFQMGRRLQDSLPTDNAAQLAADWADVRFELALDEAAFEPIALPADVDPLAALEAADVQVPEWLLAAASPNGEEGRTPTEEVP